MRLLYFAYVDLDRPNACRSHTLGLLRGFAARGCRVEAVVPRPRSLDLNLPGVGFHLLPPHQGSRKTLPLAILASFFMLWRLCRRHPYDALYARDMDVFPGPRWCSRLFGVPLFLEVDDAPVEGSYPHWLVPLVAANLRADYRRAAGLIVPSVPRGELIRREFGVPPDKVHMILNGEDPWPAAASREAARARLKVPEEALCLGYVGSVNDRYDFATMLKALALMAPRAYLVIIGDGPELPTVKALARRLGLADRVRCTGFLDHPTLARVLPALDVGLMNLTAAQVRRHGPVHTKAATYALFGLPVITAGDSLAGYPPELADLLWLVPPEDPRALAEFLLSPAAAAPERHRRGQALARYAAAHLTWEAVAGKILEVMAAGAAREAVHLRSALPGRMTC
jgi:glycosyltransferase involved in cell wall biosynthesis